MRILIISHYAESHLHSSTAQNTRFLAQGLAELGHDVHVVCASAHKGTITDDGYLLTLIPVKDLNKSERRRLKTQGLGFIFDVGRLFDEWTPDVTYVGAWGSLLSFGEASQKRQIPVVQMLHDYSLFCQKTWLLDSWGQACIGPESVEKCIACLNYGLTWKNTIREKILATPIVGGLSRLSVPQWRHHEPILPAIKSHFSRLAAYRNKVALFIAQSPMVTQLLTTNGVSPEKVQLLPQYIGEEKLLRYQPTTELLGQRPLRFVYVGRWSEEKGIHILTQAFDELQSAIPIELWVISRNIGQAQITDLEINQSKNKRIIVFNNLTGAMVSQQLANADVAIIPSICQEIASRAVLEAHAQNVPAIVSDLVGNKYTIQDGINGAIFPANDVNALKKQMKDICENPQKLQLWAQKLTPPVDYNTWIHLAEEILQKSIMIEPSPRN